MMNVKIWLGTLACLTLLLASCDKSDDTGSMTSMPRIRTITFHEGSQVSSSNFEYDASGRASKVTYSNGNYDHYEYLPGKIVMTYLREKIYINFDTLYLNDQGLVVSRMDGFSKTEFDAQGKVAIVRIAESVYKLKTEKDNTTESEEWEMKAGNLVLSFIRNYEYLPNRINTIGHENMGMAFLGKQDKNLVSSIKTTSQINGNMYTENYRYQWDYRGRVSKKWTDSYPQNYTEFSYYN